MSNKRDEASRELLALEHVSVAEEASPFVVVEGAKKARVKPDMTRMPPSALLARVAAFLPQMEQANRELDARIAR
jgi:hypothetical protein